MVASEADTDGLCHGDGRKGRRGGVERSIRSGARVPDTLLVAEMRDGALLLQGWRDGPAAYVIPEDAGPLRQALAAAFGTPTEVLP